MGQLKQLVANQMKNYLFCNSMVWVSSENNKQLDTWEPNRFLNMEIAVMISGGP
jgi:hypothetical protein